MTDHAEIAEAHVAKADEWANRDGNQFTLEWRDRMIDRELRLAQIHATLATAQRLDKLIELIFDEGRAITTASVLHGSA